MITRSRSISFYLLGYLITKMYRIFKCLFTSPAMNIKSNILEYLLSCIYTTAIGTLNVLSHLQCRSRLRSIAVSGSAPWVM